MILERIKAYMDYKGIKIAPFEKSIGMSNASFGKSLKNNGSIGTDKLENILLIYSDINPVWLLTGEGQMLKSSTPSTDGATSSPSEATPKTKKSEKISSTEDTTAFLAYMREQATAHTKAIKEKDAIIMQQNRQITDLKCQVTRLEGENQHLIDELDRIKIEHPQQSSTPQPGDTSTPQSNSTSSSLSGNTSTTQSDCTPRSHTA